MDNIITQEHIDAYQHHTKWGPLFFIGAPGMGEI